jgi:hypothetical protein
LKTELLLDLLNKLLLDEKMAVNPRQSKIDALLTSIEIGSDEKVIKTRCHGLHLADFPLILTQLCLKPRPGAKGDKVGSVGAVIATTTTKEGGPATTTATPAENAVVVKSPPSYLSVVKSGFGNKQTKQTKKGGGPAAAATTPAVESIVVVKSPPSYLSVVKSGFGNKQTKQTKKGGGPAAAAAATTPAVESIVVVKSPPSYLSVVKSGFGNKQTKQITVTPTGKICKKLMDTGACEEKKSCQHLHPVKCSYYASFGLARTNPKGCKSTDCQFLHVVICRFKYKALCKKQLCSLQHLQPKAVEKKAKVQPEEVIHHQPKETPITATPTGSFLDQGLDQRMSRIESLLLMMIPSQQRVSGWPHGTLEGGYSKN